VRNPTAKGRSVVRRTAAICDRSWSWSTEVLTPPNDPRAPQAETAAASVGPEWRVIGAAITG